MTPTDYCLEGEPHSWDCVNWTCDCGDDMCCVQCGECELIDCYCEEG